MSSPATTSLIERELLREQKYQEIYAWLAKKTPRGTKGKNLSHMLLRYVFNLSAKAMDDPVFITTPSVGADRQFKKDVATFKLGDSKHALFLAEGVSAAFRKAASEVKSAKLPVDKTVVRKIENDKAYLYYGARKFRDTRELGLQDLQAAFALQLRYAYLDLSNHGLARVYDGPKEAATEGFANPFNRYYDSYCSFFPDLEARFGSKGSFFDQQSFSTPVVQINPPFDEQLISTAAEHVYKLLTAGATNSFVFTVPNWTDFPALVRLENSKWTKNIIEYEKGELEFIDHMTGQQFSPCSILEITLSN
jgi:hypothetical protein